MKDQRSNDVLASIAYVADDMDILEAVDFYSELTTAIAEQQRMLIEEARETAGS